MFRGVYGNGWHGSAMAFFPDLSPYTYFPLVRGQRMLNVGWLGAREPFATGPFASDVLDCIVDLCRSPWNLTMGAHECELCAPVAEQPSVPLWVDYWPSGNGEIHVEGDDGIVYAAPTLIYHYIRDHGYAPPEEFTAALRAYCSCRPAAPRTKRRLYEAALRSFAEELGVLRSAFPQLPMVRERLIFFDLRAKTNFGRLKRVEDVEAILLHRAPLLSVDEAQDAAVELWAAWHRFLSHEDFEADWLRLDGPRHD